MKTDGKVKSFWRAENKLALLDFARRLKPRLLWASKKRGTYRRKEHGELPCAS